MKKAELVFVPMPGMGHLVSALEVAKLLVGLNSHLSISVLVLKPPYDPGVSSKVDALIASTISDRIKFINLPQVESDKDAPPGRFMTAIVESQRPFMKDAVANIVHDSSSVPDSPQLSGFVLDMFLTSLIDLANEFGVPSYVFYTSGAAFLGFQLHIQTGEQNVSMTELKNSDTEFTVPSYVNPVPTNVFPSVMFKPETSYMVKKLTRELGQVRGIIVNTFLELESHAVNSFSDGRLPSVYPVGPILNLNNANGSEVDQSSSDVLEWLDEQRPSSVVFLCFGSMGSFGGDQVKEIAYALEHSGHRFLWSLRKPPVDKSQIIPSPTDYENVADVLPEGFLDRTARIGKIIGWAPQVAILGNRAIGGFVSHCGWNSTLESIWFGVPIATWPLHAEQQLNAFAIVKELGIGVEIKMDYRKEVWGEDEGIEIVGAEKIERGIRCLMEQDSDVRKRVKEMSEKSRKALMDGGSSHSTLRRFIDDIMDNI